MALILNIETSSPICSVCLSKDGILLMSKESKENNTHAKLLTTLIKTLFLELKMDISDVDAIAISAGPGSYTGLRIGLSVAKGVCYALKKPLVSVSTLKSMYCGMIAKVQDKDALYMPLIAAGSGDMYTVTFDFDGNEKNISRNIEFGTVFDLETNRLQKVIIGGSGVEKCKAFLKSENVEYLENMECISENMVSISEKKFDQGLFEDVAYFEPNYLKDFIPKTAIKKQL